MSQLESDEIIDLKSLEKAGAKCIIEVLSLGLKYGLRSEKLFRFVRDPNKKQRILDFFKDSKVIYPFLDDLIKNYEKQIVEGY